MDANVENSKEKLRIDDEISRLAGELQKIEFKLEALRASRIQLDNQPQLYFEIRQRMKDFFKANS